MHAMPPRIPRNSDRPRASNRTMVDTQNTKVRLPSLRLDRRRHHRKMKATDMQTSHKGTSRANRGAHSQAVGWISRQKSSRRPVEGETFFLTSLFIDPFEVCLPPPTHSNCSRRHAQLCGLLKAGRAAMETMQVCEVSLS